RPHRLVRARRDLRAGGPDRGRVRGPDHRLPVAIGAGGGTGPADGRIGSPRNPRSRDTGSGAGRSGRELMSEQAPPGPPESPGSSRPATATKQKEKSGESRRSFGQT